VTSGKEGTKDLKVYLTDKNGNKLSFWHDLPLYSGVAPNGTVLLNYVNEIPKVYVIAKICHCA
jgi:hypothetical protein